jgi:hypothetical protein
VCFFASFISNFVITAMGLRAGLGELDKPDLFVLSTAFYPSGNARDSVHKFKMLLRAPFTSGNRGQQHYLTPHAEGRFTRSGRLAVCSRVLAVSALKSRWVSNALTKAVTGIAFPSQQALLRSGTWHCMFCTVRKCDITMQG